MLLKNISFIIAGFYFLLSLMSVGMEKITIKDPYIFIIGKSLTEKEQAKFKQYLSDNFKGDKGELSRQAIIPSHEKMQDKLALMKKHVIFDQLPGYAFYTITPAHLMAIFEGSPG